MLCFVAARRTNDERSTETRRHLLSAARQLFEKHGYAGTAIDDVVRSAGVSKGALYHHFPTKQALFDAVIVDIQDELGAHVDKSVAKQRTASTKFVTGWLAALELAPEIGIRRLMLEAPGVLGFDRWQEIDDEHYKAGVTASLAHLHSKGLLRLEPSPALAEVLMTISNALLTLLVQQDDPAAARKGIIPIWEHLLTSLLEPDRHGDTGHPGEPSS